MAKRVMLNQVALYRELDFREITMHANIDVGGYAWTKYGFVPTPESWQNLRLYLADKLERLAAENPSITQSIKDDVLELLSLDDPKTIWHVSDLSTKINDKTVGKMLLLGSDWHGSMDFLDEETIRRFIDYVK